MILNGLTVDSVIIGSPAHTSRQLARGDIIMKIDGVVATQENVRNLLIGRDAPGTTVAVTVLKARSMVRIFVSLEYA
jgi:C-terminal processing protease CtpA/Prc